jgi:hypothetical protein
MMQRHVFVAAALALVVGCSRDSSRSGPGVPTGPTGLPDALNLQLGAYRLDLTGYGLSFNPEILPCTPPFVPEEGTHVVAYVNLSRQGTDYVARQSSGSLALRFHATAARHFSDVGVEGDISGSASDSGEVPYAQPRDITVSIAGTDGATPIARIEGAQHNPLPFIQGKVTGTVNYCDSAGNCSTCPTINWTLQRAAYLD